MTLKPRHLVTVWNPAYATDALEAHLQLLLAWDAKAHANVNASANTGGSSDDDVYVWWCKVRSRQRQQDMPHLAEVLSINGQIDPDGSAESHLYLTDYRSLYVADIGLITDNDPRINDAAHVPAYYAASQLKCDCWFYLRDIRSLVRDDLEGVTKELTRLRNARYHDRPVSARSKPRCATITSARAHGTPLTSRRDASSPQPNASFANVDGIAAPTCRRYS